MRRPLPGAPPVTQAFGENAVDYSQFGLKGHHGTDYGVGTGTPVYAAEAGTVECSQNGVTDKYTGRFAAGETLVIRGSYECWYMHLSRRMVAAGARVSEGQHIGYSGATGYVTGPHLHFGIRPLTPNLNNGYRGFIDFASVLFANPAPAPTPAPAPKGGEQIMTPEQEQDAYQTVLRRPMEHKGSGRTGYQFITAAKPELAAQRKVVEQQIASLTAAVDRANKALIATQEALKNEQAKPPTEVIKEVERIVEKPVEVIKEVPVYTHDEETKQNVSTILRIVKSLWGSLTSLHKKVKR